MFKRILGVVAVVMLVAFHAAALDFEGTEFGMEWAPSTGTVDGYKVFVSRNGGEFVEETTVVPPNVILSGEVGEVIIVKVKAYNNAYESGFSPASDSIRLVTNAPGAIQLFCPDPADELVEVAPGRFSCRMQGQPY